MAAIDPRKVIFLDEPSTPTTLTPLRARAPRGERVRGRVRRGNWKALTLLATLTPTGFGHGLQFAGAVDRAIFDHFITTILVPALKPGQTVVLDNLSVHQSAVAQDLIEAAQCRLVLLPPSSPDVNPIEPAFAKLTQRLRQAAARTPDAVMDATQACYAAITASDAIGFYRDAGYNL